VRFDTGTAPAGGFAIQNIDLGLAIGKAPGTFQLQNSSNLDIQAVLKQVYPRAGLVYNMFGTGPNISFNFAALYEDTQQVVLGHYTTAGGWVIDDAVPYKLNSGASYTLELVANGDVVNLSINGSLVLTYTYGAVVTGGQFGLLAINGTAYFTSFTVTTNDPAFPTETVQHMDAAAAPTGPATGVTSLTMAEVDSELGGAINRLAAMLSLDETTIAEPWATPIQIGELPAGDLGITVDGVITLSPDADGWAGSSIRHRTPTARSRLSPPMVWPPLPAKARAANDSAVIAGRAKVEFQKRKEERAKQLRKSEAVAIATTEEAETAARVAEGDLREAEVNLELAQLEVVSSSELLKLRTIRSPIDGVVVERTLGPGEYIGFDQAHLLTVAQIDPLYVEVYMPVSQFGRIRVGMPGEVYPVVGGRYAASSSDAGKPDLTFETGGKRIIGIGQFEANPELRLDGRSPR
jgi:hypothetical protein